MGQQVDILLVEDNPADILLIREALKDARINNKMTVLNDGQAAVDYLGNSDTVLPGLILLDLGLPKINGLGVLKFIKNNDRTKKIPTVIMTTSQEEVDIIDAYDLQANCYITKPVDYDQLLKVVKSIEAFWLDVVQLPGK